MRRRPDFNTTEYRDNTIDGVKDRRRTLDYLETRTDIDTRTLGFFGYSWGGVNGPIVLAQEPPRELLIREVLDWYDTQLGQPRR